MWEKVKEFWLAILGGVVFTFFLLPSCNRPVNPILPIIPQKMSAVELQVIKKTIPDAKEAVKFSPPKPDLGKVIESVVVVKQNGEVVVINNQKLEFRYMTNLGAYADFGLLGVGGGLKVDLVGYGRANMGLFGGFPRVGANLNWQVWKNSYLGIGYGLEYTKLVMQPSLLLAVNF